MIIFLFFSGCSSIKKISKNNKNTEQTVKNKESYKPYIQKPQKNKPYNTCSFKCNTTFKSMPVTITVRTTYDSIFWASAVSLGIEAARGKCLRDSIYLINKLEKEYMQYSYPKMQVYSGLPIDFNFIQDLFSDTTTLKSYSTAKFSGKIIKKNITVDGKIVPKEVYVDGKINGKKQKITLKMSAYNFDLENQYPFEVPKNYKITR